jgi:hypothetical protein
VTRTWDEGSADHDAIPAALAQRMTAARLAHLEKLVDAALVLEACTEHIRKLHEATQRLTLNKHRPRKLSKGSVHHASHRRHDSSLFDCGTNQIRDLGGLAVET